MRLRRVRFRPMVFQSMASEERRAMVEWLVGAFGDVPMRRRLELPSEEIVFERAGL